MKVYCVVNTLGRTFYVLAEEIGEVNEKFWKAFRLSAPMEAEVQRIELLGPIVEAKDEEA